MGSSLGSGWTQRADPARHAAVPRERTDAARAIIAVRQRLSAALSEGFLYDPVFDILLTLWVAEADGRQFQADDLCRVVHAAPNSTRRWIKALLGERLIVEQGGMYGLATRGRDLLGAALGDEIVAYPAAAPPHAADQRYG